jgi:hypothetical protein
MSDDMRLPSQADLQRVTDLVTGGGVAFSALDPDRRLAVINTAIQADISDSLTNLIADTQHIGDWFRVSRTWEGP